MTEAAVSFAGTLTDDPELRHTEAGIARAMFRVAVSGRREQETSFFTVVVWRDQAEHAAESLTKGSRGRGMASRARATVQESAMASRDEDTGAAGPGVTSRASHSSGCRSGSCGRRWAFSLSLRRRHGGDSERSSGPCSADFSPGLA